MDFNLTLIGQSVAMLVFVWFCMKYIWPPMIAAIDERQKSIADGIAAGEQGRKDLDTAHTTAQNIEAEAREKAGKIVGEAESRYNDILDQARTDGQAERERQVKAARDEIDQERNRARDELRGQVASLAVAGAEQIIKREIDASAHQGLLDEMAAQI